MTAEPTPPPFPIEASRPRQLLHALVAVAGWCLFVWWWWIVFQRVSRAEIRFTLWFIGLSLAIIVLLTLLWVVHNRRIFAKRTARLNVRDEVPAVTRDTIGRELQMPSLPTEYQTAAIVRVSLEGDVKRYRVEMPHRDPRAAGGRAS